MKGRELRVPQGRGEHWRGGAPASQHSYSVTPRRSHLTATPLATPRQAHPTGHTQQVTSLSHSAHGKSGSDGRERQVEEREGLRGDGELQGTALDRLERRESVSCSGPALDKRTGMAQGDWCWSNTFTLVLPGCGVAGCTQVSWRESVQGGGALGSGRQMGVPTPAPQKETRSFPNVIKWQSSVSVSQRKSERAEHDHVCHWGTYKAARQDAILLARVSPAAPSGNREVGRESKGRLFTPASSISQSSSVTSHQPPCIVEDSRDPELIDN
ncbi:hypothetical protein O3P69_004285 [Scylla paramamosain]|uniref:Uncharacterized protein n=1 Tax=Scylla paramamosain TaxID=85552 RepID=A0AAW0UG34_SCYPA